MGWTVTDRLECMYVTVEQANAFHSPLVTYTDDFNLTVFLLKKSFHRHFVRGYEETGFLMLCKAIKNIEF